NVKINKRCFLKTIKFDHYILMDSSLIAQLILRFGYPIIFLLVVYEGPLVTIAAAFFAASGYLNVFILYPLIVIADLSSDIMWYYVGYFGREKVINRWGRFFGLHSDNLEKFQKLNNRFKNHQGKILFIAKISHVIGFPFLINAGMFKWDIRKYILFNFLATIPKTLGFMILGYFFGKAGNIISRYLGYGTYIGIGAFVCLIITYFLIVKFAKKKFKNYEE
ncbi:MAG: VTT domain-containing protein, partial [Actinomycetota bacterium]